ADHLALDESRVFAENPGKIVGKMRGTGLSGRRVDDTARRGRSYVRIGDPLRRIPRNRPLIVAHHRVARPHVGGDGAPKLLASHGEFNGMCLSRSYSGRGFCGVRSSSYIVSRVGSVTASPSEILRKITEAGSNELV